MHIEIVSLLLDSLVVRTQRPISKIPKGHVFVMKFLKQLLMEGDRTERLVGLTLAKFFFGVS